MTQEEIIRMMQGGFGGNQQTTNIPVEKIDEFIQRCLTERGETLYTLAQALQWKLQAAQMISFPELEVYPLVLQRLQQKLSRGEN